MYWPSGGFVVIWGGGGRKGRHQQIQLPAPIIVPSHRLFRNYRRLIGTWYRTAVVFNVRWQFVRVATLGQLDARPAASRWRN